MSERWPALMLRETAAEYCDMTPTQFDRQCPIEPVDQGWRGLRWKRKKLDDWIDALPEKPRERKGAITEIGLDEPQTGAANDRRSGVDDPPPGEALTPEARRKASLARIKN